MKEAKKKRLILSCVLVFILLLSACGDSGSGAGNGSELTSTEITDLDSEEFTAQIFDLAAAASGDSAHSADSQNAEVEMSSDNARDYIIKYDSGRFHLYTTPTGNVKTAYGAVENNEMAPYIISAITASLDSSVSMKTALEEVEGVIAEGSSPLVLDDVVLVISGDADSDYLLIICNTIEEYSNDSFYEDRMGSDLDIVMYMVGITLD